MSYLLHRAFQEESDDEKARRRRDEYYYTTDTELLDPQGAGTPAWNNNNTIDTVKQSVQGSSAQQGALPTHSECRTPPLCAERHIRSDSDVEILDVSEVADAALCPPVVDACLFPLSRRKVQKEISPKRWERRVRSVGPQYRNPQGSGGPPHPAKEEVCSLPGRCTYGAAASGRRGASLTRRGRPASERDQEIILDELPSPHFASRTICLPACSAEVWHSSHAVVDEISVLPPVSARRRKSVTRTHTPQCETGRNKRQQKDSDMPVQSPSEAIRALRHRLLHRWGGIFFCAEGERGHASSSTGWAPSPSFWCMSSDNPEAIPNPDRRSMTSSTAAAPSTRERTVAFLLQALCANTEQRQLLAPKQPSTSLTATTLLSNTKTTATHSPQPAALDTRDADMAGPNAYYRDPAAPWSAAQLPHPHSFSIRRSS